jgi:hypothetical protein
MSAIAGKPAPAKNVLCWEGREQIACHCAKKTLQALQGGACGAPAGGGAVRRVLICKQGNGGKLLLQQQGTSSFALYFPMEYIKNN